MNVQLVANLIVFLYLGNLTSLVQKFVDKNRYADMFIPSSSAENREFDFIIGMTQ